MQGKKILIITAVFIMSLFLHACLTTGDRVNMEEFKRQLEAGGQAISVTETAATDAAATEATVQETKVVAAAATAKEATAEPTAVPTEVPAAIPAAKPIKKIEPAVKAAAPKVEKQPAVEAKAAPAKKEEPVKQAGAQAGGDYRLMLAAVFAAAFAVFALIVFIFTRKKKDEDGDTMPDPVVKAAAETPQKAVSDYKETAALKPAQQQKPAPVQQSPAAAAQEPEPEPAVEEKPQEPDNFSETTASVDAAPLPPPLAAMPEKQSQFGEGIAGISPTQFAAGGQGLAVHLLYKVGGDSPEYRTIKITVPEGWSRPGTLNTDEGYFTASVNGGRLISTAAENMSMLITVYGLPADTGEVAIVYGERRGGSTGVRVQAQPGEAVFKIETEGRGSTELKEIEDSPVVDVN